MKQYVLFDLDGTISDSKIGIINSVQYALNSFGISVINPDDLRPFLGPPLRESFMKFYDFDEAGAEIAVSKYREYYTTKGIYENVLYDGISDMLKCLKRSGKTIILATSKPAVYAEKILKYFNIDDLFDFVSGSELDGGRSIKSEVIEYALRQNQITELDSVIMVGDRKHDIIGAAQTGIQSIGVLYGYGSFEELSNAGATKIVANVDELSATLLDEAYKLR